MKTRSSIRTNLHLIAVILITSGGCTDGGHFFKDAPGGAGPGVVFFTTPIITNTSVISVTVSKASCSASFTTYTSIITDRGFCWSSLHIPTTGDSIISVQPSGNIGFNENIADTLTGLKANRQYSVSAFATNSYGTKYGSPVSFLTLPDVPVLTTSFVFDFTSNTAIVGGNVILEGMTFVTDRGICWNTLPDPETNGTRNSVGSGSGPFSTKLTGLNPNTAYYVRAYATNSVGTGYGLQYNFNTGKDTSMPRVMDIDGNNYHYVTIGAQVWIVENLKTTKFNDGTPIPLDKGEMNWGALLTPAYCYLNLNDSTYKNTYGGLYNWYAINTGKLCPTGWHIPTDAEWKILQSVPVIRLRETGSEHWISRNADATNETGFTGMPGGTRLPDGYFGSMGEKGLWWSSTDTTATTAWSYTMTAYPMDENFSRIRREIASKKSGISVRCIKN
jgi:uncharacterized protein (TIGR02145 family)